MGTGRIVLSLVVGLSLVACRRAGPSAMPASGVAAASASAAPSASAPTKPAATTRLVDVPNTARGVTAVSSGVYFTIGKTNVTLVRVPLHGGAPQTVVEGGSSYVVDDANVYWVEGDRIKKRLLGGGPITAVSIGPDRFGPLRANAKALYWRYYSSSVFSFGVLAKSGASAPIRFSGGNEFFTDFVWDDDGLWFADIHGATRADLPGLVTVHHVDAAGLEITMTYPRPSQIWISMTSDATSLYVADATSIRAIEKSAFGASGGQPSIVTDAADFPVSPIVDGDRLCWAEGQYAKFPGVYCVWKTGGLPTGIFDGAVNGFSILDGTLYALTPDALFAVAMVP